MRAASGSVVTSSAASGMEARIAFRHVVRVDRRTASAAAITTARSVATASVGTEPDTQSRRGPTRVTTKRSRMVLPDCLSTE